jgi:TolA-binding protein
VNAVLDVEKEIYRFSDIKEIDVLDTANDSIDSDSLRKAVQLYNQALTSIQTKSDDIAVIELKKAISIYPDFIEAKVLLSLCYIIRKQIKEAEELLLDITNSDDYLARAHQYLQYINSIKLKQKSGKDGNKASISRHFFKPKINIDHFKIDIFKICVIFFIGVFISYVFFHNSITALKNHNAEKTAYSDSIKTDYEKKFELYDSQIATAKSKITELQQQIDQSNKDISYLSNVKKLLAIEQANNNGDKEKAADMLVALKDFEFRDIEKQKYQSLYEKIIPNLARNFYYQGYSFYESRKYSEAIDAFNKSLKYDPRGDNAQYVLYFAARCYQIQGDKMNAADYYNQLINYFPNSKYASYAKNRLNQINNP